MRAVICCDFWAGCSLSMSSAVFPWQSRMLTSIPMGQGKKRGERKTYTITKKGSYKEHECHYSSLPRTTALTVSVNVRILNNSFIVTREEEIHNANEKTYYTHFTLPVLHKHYRIGGIIFPLTEYNQFRFKKKKKKYNIPKPIHCAGSSQISDFLFHRWLWEGNCKVTHTRSYGTEARGYHALLKKKKNSKFITLKRETEWLTWVKQEPNYIHLSI